MKKFTLKIPATSANLGPGYDVLGMALEVFNFFEVTVFDSEMGNSKGHSMKKLTIEITGEGSGELPTDENNLIYKATLEACKKAGVELPPLLIKQHNNVPLNRGMGSSATAVLGGVLIAREIIGDKLDEETLLQLAVKLEGHPDNLLAAYYGGVVINYREKDIYRGVNFMPPSPIKAVLAIPDIQVSTKKARELLPGSYSTTDVVANLRNISLLTFALQTGRLDLLNIAMEDRVHTPYRAEMIPGYFDVEKAVKEAGALGFAISGSGSTVIALCDKNESKIARKMEEIFNNHSVNCRTIITKISKNGVIITNS